MKTKSHYFCCQRNVNTDLVRDTAVYFEPRLRTYILFAKEISLQETAAFS